MFSNVEFFGFVWIFGYPVDTFLFFYGGLQLSRCGHCQRPLSLVLFQLAFPPEQERTQSPYWWPLQLYPCGHSQRPLSLVLLAFPPEQERAQSP